MPNIEYEAELSAQKLNKTYLEEVEKYKKEVLHEGLQVEEEGLPDIHRKRLSSSQRNGTSGILRVGLERARNKKPRKNTTAAEGREGQTSTRHAGGERMDGGATRSPLNVIENGGQHPTTRPRRKGNKEHRRRRNRVKNRRTSQG